MNSARLCVVLRSRFCWTLLIIAALLLAAATRCQAGGPRFVTGQGMWTSPGNPETWNTRQLLYFTDPGDLAAGVSHAQADMLVAAAAATWNVPSSSIAVAQGGELAEHVDGGNSSFDGTNFTFPQDVEASNEAVVPLAVLYDTDGSLTEMVLGAGSSDPSECWQYAVTESVDDIQMDGAIHHALLILNGRCVGSTPQQLQQMQYQLMRAFGRVLGLAWAQTNDNVFTGASPVSAQQIQFWPVMHPLDILCGPYTYQCVTQPFTLREDDLDSLALLYPVTPANQTAGEQVTGEGMAASWGRLSFPDGQGMAWANVSVHRLHNGAQEPWETVSSVTGYPYQQALANPVTEVQATNAGTNDGGTEGLYYTPAVSIDGLSNLYFTTTSINPLYVGEYALAPYVRPPVEPSGSSQTAVAWSDLGGVFAGLMTAWDAAASCAPGNDGTEGEPALLNPSGWQSGQTCGWGHNSWWSVAVRAGRSWTLELTATDEEGNASLSKMQPVTGIWAAVDPTGTLPTLASQPVPFNSLAFGVTQILMPANASDTGMRFVVSDEYGAGRPDFTYTARVFYADSIAPSTVGAGGGAVTLSGMGFRRGNLVQINGVNATVQSWTANTIVAVLPSINVASAAVGQPLAVTVIDTDTGATSTIENALTYTDAADQIQVVSAPASLETGLAAAVPFTVRVLASDGTTPIAGAVVSFAVTQGAASLGVCAAGSSAGVCTVLTDATGAAQTSITGEAAGAVVLTATEVSGGASVQVSLMDADPVRAVIFAPPDVYLAAGTGGTWTLRLQATQDSVGVPGAAVAWQTSSAVVSHGAATTDASGSAQLTIAIATVAAGSSTTISGCVWSTVCAAWNAIGVDPSLWQVAPQTGADQNVAATATLGPVTVVVTDGAGHVVQGAPVTVYQRVLAWGGVCSAGTRCPAAPVLASSQQTATSAADGTISITPMQLSGVPQIVQIAVTTGNAGLTTMTLLKTPVTP